MDIEEKIGLVKKNPTHEVVTEEELRNLFSQKSRPNHYIGIEISGFLHLGSLILTGFKINDFIKAGVNSTVFLADWHTFINDKMGGNWDTIRKVSGYYKQAFEALCPGVNVVYGSDLYESNQEYWKNLIKLTKQVSISRIMRTLTIMGRSEKEKLDLSQMLYPPMQAVDIHAMELDIVHSGIDQRKIHMLVREVFPKLGWKTPVAVHHQLLPGLAEPEQDNSGQAEAEDSEISTKMSKSKPSSGIFIHDSDDEIKGKIKKAWCPEGQIQDNPVLEILKHVIFHEFDQVKVERPSKFGGDITYSSFEQASQDFQNKSLHPLDLKKCVGEYLAGIIRPIREKVVLNEETVNAINDTVTM